MKWRHMYIAAMKAKHGGDGAMKATRDQAHDYLADLLAGENAVAVPPGPEREELINELARQEVPRPNAGLDLATFKEGLVP